MRKLVKVLALVLTLAMVLGLAACTSKPAETTATPAETTATPAPSNNESNNQESEATPEPTPEPSAEPTTMVYATSTFGQKFSPFFATTAYDTEVVNMTTIGLLAADRGGAVIFNGIEGETVTYNGTDYTYYGAGDVEVVQNADGSVDYNLTMRDDIYFSDGVKATIDDVIFGIYVMCDPTYDGSSTLYALPIEGMEEYRSGMDSRGNAIYAAGPDNTDFSLWTEEQQTAFWDFYNNNAINCLAQNIVDYVYTNYAAGYGPDYIGKTAEEIGADEGIKVAFGMVMWGFGDFNEDGLFVDALGNTYDLEAGQTPTIEDYGAAIAGSYDTIEDAFATENTAGETAVSETIKALGSDYEMGVQTGTGAPNISGIKKTGDYTMTVHTTSYDATAIYNMSFTIAPLHYYGDAALYNYDANQFGFVKGDLSGVKAKNTAPLGAGPYIYQGYQNGVVTLEANKNYYLGATETDYLLMQESVDADYVPGIVSGTFDIAVPSINDDTLNAIKDANSNGEIVGDTVTTVLVDYRGYGYIGINADLVNMGEPGSDASKNLRKGFMTMLSVYRDTVVNSYYGDRASVIQYPISNTSWAAPQPADVGYKNAYSTTVDGNPIYDSSMSEDQKYEAALAAAVDYFKAAGLPYDEATGKFTTDQSWEIMIPGQGNGDHPAYGIATAASTALESIGIKLQVNDVGTSTWNNALEGNTAQMWAAAWQSTVDPDMTQVYHSSNAHGNGTNSNHYSVDDPALDELIARGRASADTEERKSIYKEAMEIILDWGCELPTYQRKDCSTFSTQRIDIDTIPQDMTPYWGWAAEIETLATK